MMTSASPPKELADRRTRPTLTDRTNTNESDRASKTASHCSEDERPQALAALEAKVRLLESENVQVSFLRERVRAYEERCAEYNLASQVRTSGEQPWRESLLITRPA